MARNQCAQRTTSSNHWASVREPSSDLASGLQASLTPMGAEGYCPHCTMSKLQIHGSSNGGVILNHSSFSNWNKPSSASLSHHSGHPTPLISLFLSDHDGKLSSIRSNRAYLQCFPQSLTQRGPRHNHCDDLRRTTEMKTFFDLLS